MVGQLQDAGNTTTLALNLLSSAGILAGLPKFSGQRARQRGSSPKFQVLNTALMAALTSLDFDEARKDREFRGRLVESAIGAHLLNSAAGTKLEVFYWRDRNREVDFALRAGKREVAIEVKSGRRRDTFPGLEAFAKALRQHRVLVVGDQGIPVEECLLRQAAAYWLEP